MDKKPTLFRKEAIDAKKNRLEGNIVLSQPIVHIALTYITIIVLIGLMCIIVFATYSKKQKATGYLVPTEGIVKIYPKQTARLERLDVKEGSIVQAGQTLASFSNLRFTTASEDADSELRKQIQNSIDAVSSKIEFESDILRGDSERLASQIKLSERNIQLISERLRTESALADIVEAKKSRFSELLAQGHVSDIQYREVVGEWLNAQSSLSEISRQNDMEAGNLTDLRLQADLLPSRSSSKIADLKTQLYDLKQRIIEIESRREHSVLAPINGRITTIQGKIGQTVDSRIPLLTIVPLHSVYEAHLYVPTKAIGLIEKNQRVKLKYQAFPYQRYGLYSGNVSEIGESILSSSEIPFSLPLGDEPVYRITVALNEQNVIAFGKTFHLQPGMLVDADVVFDNRPIWQWLFAPLININDEV